MDQTSPWLLVVYIQLAVKTDSEIPFDVFDCFGCGLSREMTEVISRLNNCSVLGESSNVPEC